MPMENGAILSRSHGSAWERAPFSIAQEAKHLYNPLQLTSYTCCHHLVKWHCHQIVAQKPGFFRSRSVAQPFA
ncbi:MAG: hypothetical protein EBE86_029530 [Hormoscilla sp. GUM202]|nr:hypothetical protein [Hormoscilla sp. GUM202]